MEPRAASFTVDTHSPNYVQSKIRIAHRRTSSGSPSCVLTALPSPASSSSSEVLPLTVASVETVEAYPASESPPSLRARSLHPALVAAWDAEQDFTPAQREAMASLRSELRRRGLLDGSNGTLFDNAPAMYRFACARGYDVARAVEMFEAHAKWRRDWDLDDLVPDPVAGGSACDCPRLLATFSLPQKAAIKAAWPFVYHKTTRAGLPVYYERTGSIHFTQLRAATSVDDLLRAIVFDSEATQHWRLPACSLAAGKYMGKSVTVLDMGGLQLSTFDADCRKQVATVAAISSDNFPESLHKMFIVNAPKIFRVVWAVVRTFLDKRTRDKIAILGGRDEYLPHLLEEIDAQNLPTFLGGQDDSIDFINEQGPWAAFVPDPAAR